MPLLPVRQIPRLLADLAAEIAELGGPQALKERLDTRDYLDEDGNEIKEEHRTIEDDDEHNLYPVLRAVQEGRE